MTFDAYLAGAIRHLEARGHSMLAAIRADLPRDYDALVVKVTDGIKASLQQLARLREDANLQLPKNAGVRSRTFNREVAALENLERFGITLLSRAHTADNSLNHLIDAIKRETGFPLVAPVVSPFSSSYYVAVPSLHLIAVPLLEQSFVLQLPDLYHELAHFLFEGFQNPRLAPFIEELVAAGGAVTEYYAERIHEANRGFTPTTRLEFLAICDSTWIKYWLVEFFCDAFATACLGPAYGWAHLLLTLKGAHNPFATPDERVMTHPPEDARMQLILGILSQNGHADAAKEMHSLWQELLLAKGFVREPEYDMAVPGELRDIVMDHALVGLQRINCRFATPGDVQPVAQLLNDAWASFLVDPMAFSSREPTFRQRIVSAAAP